MISVQLTDQDQYTMACSFDQRISDLAITSSASKPATCDQIGCEIFELIVQSSLMLRKHTL
jgi:hypothetical protein